jgi:hypothetical protein
MTSRLRRILLSILAGLITPFLMLPLLAIEGGIAGALESRGTLAVLFVTAILFATAIASWRPIVPTAYGLTVAITFYGASYLILASRPGNLAGLVLFFSTVFGIVIGVCTAALAILIRQLLFPAWFPLAVVGVALMLAAASYARTARVHTDQENEIVSHLQSIRKAELAYAATRADHAFTCNGPDLPGLSEINWTPEAAVGTMRRNQARIAGHWVLLECEWSAQPHSFRVRAIRSSKEEVDIDDAGRLTRMSPIIVR